MIFNYRILDDGKTEMLLEPENDDDFTNIQRIKGNFRDIYFNIKHTIKSEDFTFRLIDHNLHLQVLINHELPGETSKQLGEGLKKLTQSKLK
jgi:predicted RNA-binding protein associated with RNAse of E/G family